MTAVHSAIYEGRLEHARRGPRAHQFAYRQRLFYLDLDELETLLAPAGLLRRGRVGALSFHRPDYLGDPGRPLKIAVADLVETRLGCRPAGPIRMLTHVRTFGYVFNPVTFYYCFAADGHTLDAIVAEITNTPWGERHAYVLPAGAAGVRAEFDKTFHVSPFFDLSQRYRWVFTTPDHALAVTMVTLEQGREVFTATLRLQRHPLTTARLWSLVLRQPLASLRGHAAIYWQAARLWWKRTPFFEHPSTRTVSTPVGRSTSWKS